MLEYVEALDTYNGGKPSLFLAGGIQGTPNWQKDFVEKLGDLDIVVYNPRRKNFPIKDPNAAEEQITWEYKHLRKADVITFWFPKETDCPITLFELGAHSKGNKPITVGVHKEYSRKQDVEIQMKLVRPELEIVYNLEDLVEQTKKAMRKLL